jgi:flagellar protein FliO/FliZ
MKQVLNQILPAFLVFFLIFPAKIAFCSTGPDTPFSATLRLVWGLLIVLGILFIIYGLMKKKMSFLQTPGKGLIKIIEVRHLMPKKSLYLVEIRGQEFLLGAGNDRIDLIAAINGKPEGSFTEILHQCETEATK